MTKEEEEANIPLLMLAIFLGNQEKASDQSTQYERSLIAYTFSSSFSYEQEDIIWLTSLLCDEAKLVREESVIFSLCNLFLFPS